MSIFQNFFNFFTMGPKFFFLFSRDKVSNNLFITKKTKKSKFI